MLIRKLSAVSTTGTTGRAAAAVSKASPVIHPSLGASGAIYAAVTLSALAFPDSQVAIIFLPWLAVPITYGVGSMVLLDIMGVIRGWQ